MFFRQNYYQQQNTHTIKIIDTNEFLLIRPSRDSNLNIDVRIVTQAHSVAMISLWIPYFELEIKQDTICKPLIK